AVTDFDEKLRCVPVQAIIAISVVDNQEVPIAFKPIRVDHLPRLDDPKVAPWQRPDTDALVEGKGVIDRMFDLAIARHQLASHRPGESTAQLGELPLPVGPGVSLDGWPLRR